jgi:hypothetical protein
MLLVSTLRILLQTETLENPVGSAQNARSPRPDITYMVRVDRRVVIGGMGFWQQQVE